MGGLTFGGGYFGQYSMGGSAPVEQAAAADMIVRVGELAYHVEAPDLAGSVRVPALTFEIEIDGN